MHGPLFNQAVAIMDLDWKARCAARKQQQLDEIPKEWIIQPPPPEQVNVIDVPRSCPLLTERELRITETTDIGLMLRFLASGHWSSYEVTLAFYKRAIIAHQLVGSLLTHSDRCITHHPD